MSPVDPSQLDRALAQIRSEYGDSSVRMGSAYSDPPRISTGSLELDIITGGGIPIGRMNHWYGGQFSGKSLTVWNTIANAQEMGQVCAFYDIEKQFSPSWAVKHGVDIDKLIVVEKTTIEDVGAAMEALMPSVHFHALDSLAAAVSLDELAADANEWRPGISARAWGKVLRRVQERFDPRENTVVMINHVGTVFGKYAGGDEPKGAKFVEYLSSLSLEFRRSSWLFKDKDGNLRTEGKNDATLSKDNQPQGIEFQVRVKKSRVCVPFQSARLRLDFETGGVDDMWSLAKAAQLYEMIEKKGTWMTLPDGNKVQGEYQLKNYIKENEEFRNQIVEKLWQNMK